MTPADNAARKVRIKKDEGRNSEPDNAERQGAARESLLARYPVTFYFVIAYAARKV